MRQILLLLSLCSLLIAPMSAFARGEMCTNIDLDELIAGNAYNPETLERLRALKVKASNFLMAKEKSGEIPPALDVETAVELVDFLRLEGFHELSIRITESESHWWKYPALVTVGLSTFAGVGYGVTLWGAASYSGRSAMGASLNGAILGLFVGLVAGIGIPSLLDDFTDIGTDVPFVCDLHWSYADSLFD